MNVLSLAVVVFLISSTEAIDHINIFEQSNLTIPKCIRKEHARQRRSFYSTKHPLHCPPCEQIHCYKQRKRRLNCKGGYTVGVCGCCRVCAKLENEQCGGDYNYLGRCDKGLVCEPQPPTEVTFMKDGVKTLYRVHKGICIKALTAMTPVRFHCKPKCDPDFCNKNPRAICSAAHNAENVKNCQGKCQHTSCRACRFVEIEERCSQCELDDFKCIRQFGRCMRKKSCEPQRYPCGKVKAVDSSGEDIQHEERERLQPGEANLETSGSGLEYSPTTTTYKSVYVRDHRVLEHEMANGHEKFVCVIPECIQETEKITEDKKS